MGRHRCANGQWLDGASNMALLVIVPQSYSYRTVWLHGAGWSCSMFAKQINGREFAFARWVISLQRLLAFGSKRHCELCEAGRACWRGQFASMRAFIQ